MNGASPGPGIGETLVSSRSLAEYTAMFALTADDLTGRLLDCPGGAASFTAEASARGSDMTAVDPTYGGGPAGLSALADHAAGEAVRGSDHVERHADRYGWTFFTDPADHRRQRVDAAAAFAVDVAAHPDRYVAGALPHLPFADGAFDLVLCSHLLFTYDDRLDEAWHLGALLEMVRVSSGQVRVFPLVSHVYGRRSAFLDDLRQDLTARGLTSRVQRVAYELQRGGHDMLVIEGGQS